MSETETVARTVSHASFTIERTYPEVTPARVFEAFSTAKGKDAWFCGPDERWELVERTLDFRVGGRERLAGRWQEGWVAEFDATYWDIVPGERIVYAYSMRLDGRKASVSLATFEFKPAAGGGAHLRMHEQGAFLDGYDDNGARERGSRELIDKLSAYLAASAA
jgi:uncharacterized protein YndB with AHSA1/START domain